VGLAHKDDPARSVASPDEIAARVEQSDAGTEKS
jgi:hypothetical protein